MMIKSLLLLSVTFAGQFALAGFSANFASFETIVTNTDGTPMASMVVQYNVEASVLSTCGGRRGSPFDVGTPCEATFNPEGDNIVHYAVTDANGRAIIPALSVSSNKLTARNPLLKVFVGGAEVPLQTPQGTFKCMPLPEPITDWSRSDSREITEEVSTDLANTSLKFQFINWSNKYQFSYEEYFQKVTDYAARDYAQNGPGYVGVQGPCYK